jgi:hypothetical protein
MPKDVALLRDLWKTIDPTHPIATMSKETKNAIVSANRVDEALKRRDRQRAHSRKQRLITNGSRVPPSLEHYLHGVDTARGSWKREGNWKYKLM